MYQDSKRTCAAIVLIMKSFAWCRSRRRNHRGLLKLPNEKKEESYYRVHAKITLAVITSFV